MLVVRFCALAASPWPSGSHATLFRIVRGRASRSRRSPLSPSKSETVARNSGAGFRSATAIVRPSGDQLGPPWYDSGSETDASTRSLELRARSMTSRLCFSGLTRRQNAMRFPSGEKLDPRVDVEGALARGAAERGDLDQRPVVRVVGLARAGRRGSCRRARTTRPSSRRPASGRTSTSLPVATWRTRRLARPAAPGEVGEVAPVGRDRGLVHVAAARLGRHAHASGTPGAASAARARGAGAHHADGDRRRARRARRPRATSFRERRAASEPRRSADACVAELAARGERVVLVDDLAQLDREVLHRLDALVGALGEAAPDEAAQLGGRLVVELLDGDGLLVEDLVHRLDGGLGHERPLARRRLVEDAAEREDVGRGGRPPCPAPAPATCSRPSRPRCPARCRPAARVGVARRCRMPPRRASR